MLQRVVGLLGTVVDPIVVVAARDQELPELPPAVSITRDEQDARGPLEGLRAGMKALPLPQMRRMSPVATFRCWCRHSCSD